MQVSVQTLSGLERQISVAVPAEKIETEIKNRLSSLSQRAKIAGFRPGKVPMSVIKQHYGAQVQQEVMGELVEASFYEAVTKEKLRPAGLPQIQPKSRAAGQPLEYTATFEIYPEVKLSSLDNVVIERPVATITDADIDGVIENIRKQRLAWSSVSRTSRMGDRVRIAFKGQLNGADFAGNEANDMPVELGKNRMIPGFEDQLVGVTAGQSKSFTLRFPADYHNKDLADQDVQFNVTVNSVEESRLPDVNEEFIRSLGVADGSIEAFRADVRQNMQREADTRIKAELKQNVMDALLKNNQIDVPKSLIAQEVKTLLGARQQQGEQYNPRANPEIDGKIEELGRRRVALALILSEIIKQQKLKVEPKKLREAVEHFASTYEKPAEVVQWYYADKKRLSEVESYVLEDEVVNWVVSNGKLKDVATTFDALIKQGQTAA